MKALLVSTPVMGHLNPLLSIGRILVSDGLRRRRLRASGEYLNSRLAEIGVEPLRKNLYDAMVELPDAYLLLTVPRFELPRRALAPSVHFVGPLPITPNQAPIPPWAQDLDGSRKVVLVTQGTLTNDDVSELVRLRQRQSGVEFRRSDRDRGNSGGQRRRERARRLVRRWRQSGNQCAHRGGVTSGGTLGAGRSEVSCAGSVIRRGGARYRHPIGNPSDSPAAGPDPARSGAASSEFLTTST